MAKIEKLFTYLLSLLTRRAELLVSRLSYTFTRKGQSTQDHSEILEIKRKIWNEVLSGYKIFESIWKSNMASSSTFCPGGNRIYCVYLRSGAKVKYSWFRLSSPSVFPVYQVNGTCSSGMCKFEALIFSENVLILKVVVYLGEATALTQR